MAVSGIGPIEPPLEITVEKGKVSNVFSADALLLKKVNESLDTNEWLSVVGEFDVEINPKV